MKALIAHHDWRGIGGSRLLSAYMLKTMADLGYDTVISSTYNFQEDYLKSG